MSATPKLPTHGVHVPALDGIRGLAISLVMLQHFFLHVDKGPNLVDDVVFGIAARAWMGVDLFFVLSGFLITGILWDAKGRDGYLRNFYARRVLRIFPAYYATLLIFFVALPLVPVDAVQSYVAGQRPGQAWHWLYLSNFYIAWQGHWFPDHIPNVFWSLAIEEQFYLAWPFVVLACGRRALLATCVVLFVAAQAIRAYLAVATDLTWVTTFVLTPTRMDGLVCGAFLAILARSDIDIARSRRVLLAIGIASAVPLAYLALQRGPDWRDDLQQTFRFACVALCAGAMLWLTVTGPDRGILRRAFDTRALRFLGKYSYAMYLWHGPGLNLAGRLFDPNDTALIATSRLPMQLVYVAIAFALTLAFALASWHVVEKHFLRLKRWFLP